MTRKERKKTNVTLQGANGFLNPSEWEPGADALRKFAEHYPAFGLRPDAPTGFHHFTRTHGEKLHAAGVLVRTHTGAWVAHKEYFPRAVTALLMGQHVPCLVNLPRKAAAR